MNDTASRNATGPERSTSLTRAEIEAIATTGLANPFSLLGPHQVGSDRWEVRVFAPQARAVDVVGHDGGLLCKLERIDRSGLFVGSLHSENRPDYLLRFEEADGSSVAPDVYSIGLLLNDGEMASFRGATGGELYRALGAHPMTWQGHAGTRVAVWAPNARRVSVVGDFNSWDGRRHAMRLRHGTGIWELFIPNLNSGATYKFEIVGPDNHMQPLKADPMAFAAERPPATASVVHGLPHYDWQDSAWRARSTDDPRAVPMSIYECHLASWARVPEEGARYLTYEELAARLIPYVKDLGFTHIELLPITEYPFDGSWGYQPTSLYAPTRRFGRPEDFNRFVDAAHAAGIGVLLDWVPAHFPNDPHGLGFFDGTHLYEHADPRQGYHRDWGTFIYNFGRDEVVAFLTANARFWLEHYHLDGLRVDAVASLLYLDYSRPAGEWIPNRYGGNENLEAIAFLRRMNEIAYANAAHIVTIAEESTAWPGVSQPTYTGGLGFGFKWNMGWMHDTLRYMEKDPIYRSHHYHDLTFGLLYAFSENFILPLSHDEVVHGKRSLIGKMPGDQWQRFANLRAYYGFMWGHPGKKLLFMGGEFAQEREWNHDTSLDWHLLDLPAHGGIKTLVRDLNHAYRDLPALHKRDCEASGFRWLVTDDRDNSVIAFARFASADDVAIVISNFTPVPHLSYRIGVPAGGYYREAINTDANAYGGSNMGNMGGCQAVQTPSHGQEWSIELTIPPLATLILSRSP